MKHLFRPCPICDNLSGEVLHRQLFSSPSGSPLPTEYEVVFCSKCGFVFADTSANQDDYNTYYSILSKYENPGLSSGSGFSQNDYDRLSRTADTLEIYLKKNDSILDLGCANGGQLKILKERGFTNLTGIDPSRVCVANVNSADIEAFQTHIFEKSFVDWNKKFDLIILSHVLEHILDLEKAIKIVKSKLTDKGILYIELPDASRYNNFFVVPYYYIDSEHINHFSIISLNNLLLKFNFLSLETVQSTIKLNETTDYPVFYSIFGQKDSICNSLIRDQTIINSFRQFLRQSKRRNNLNTIIQKVVSTQEKVIIWGAGQFALRLLASSALSDANIIGFVDSDISKQNKKIGKFEVHSPDYLVDKNVTLLICSALYADEILKTALHLNKTIKYIIIK